ncbi:MAG: hypothetical protein C5S40_07515 [ANME-2 cluster archaeon]|nr:hypothetical protein [ANME-2 cluster archaeon]
MVIIATNVHQQMLLFIEESREIKQKQDIKVAILKGKKHMCPRDEDYETCSVLRENTYELIGKEREITELESYLDPQQELKPGPDKAASGSGRIMSGELDELEKRVRELRDRHCSYRYKVAISDLLGWIDRGLDDVIIFFDEAHNIESAARSHASMLLPEYSLQHAYEEVTANEAIG